MKFLIIYYSFSGNNRLLAQHLAKRLNCDICPIIEKKRRTMFTILLDMIFRREPQIKDLEFPVSDYDHIILLAPIWGSKLANPMTSLLKREKTALSNFSFISLCGYERTGQKEKITKQLNAITETSPKAVVELRICDLFPPEKRNEIKTVSRYHAKSEDLLIYDSQINEFLNLIH